MLFIKIVLSFPLLIPCLILPTDDRENSERTPTQLSETKKCYLLRLPPKKVDYIPKKVDCVPEIVANPQNKKIASKCDFPCSIQNNSLPLHREPALGMSAHQRRRVADIIKGVYWRLFWSVEIRKIS